MLLIGFFGRENVREIKTLNLDIRRIKIMKDHIKNPLLRYLRELKEREREYIGRSRKYREYIDNYTTWLSRNEETLIDIRNKIKDTEIVLND